MKKLIIVFSLIAGSINGQVPIGTIESYSIDTNLNRYFFDKLNEYRNSINQESWEWSNDSYDNSLNWNIYLSDNQVWGHSNGDNCVSEFIVGINLQPGDNINYQTISDSCLMQLIHSPYHKGGIESPKKTKTRKTAKVLHHAVDFYFDRVLSSHGSVSVIIQQLPNQWKRVTFVIQLI